MRGAWAYVLISVIAVAFLSPALAKALPPEVTIIPNVDNKIISVNSDFAVRVDPKTNDRPVRITWLAYDTGSIGVGSFPLVDGKGMCYFSESDGNATCGPSPFFQAGETELYVSVVKPGTTTTATNVTVPLNISPLTIDVDGVGRENNTNTVYMVFYMSQKSRLTYSIYREDFTSYQPEKELAYKGPPFSRYESNITLNPGVYYFAFILNDAGTFGTALKRIEIPSADFLTIQTDKKGYFKGEKIRVSGSGSGDVSGEVRFPNGNKALDFTANVSADGSFSYEFYAESEWPAGKYEISTSRPVTKAVSFNVTDFLEVTPASVSRAVNKSDDFSASLTLKNVMQNATNISFTVSGDIDEEYITIGKTRLGPQESTTLEIEIPSVESDMSGSVTLEVTGGLKLAIPVRLTVTEGGEQPCTAANALEISQDSVIWSQECLAGEQVAHSVEIINNGASVLSGFQYDVYDAYETGQSLENLDIMGNIDVPVDGLSIAALGSEEIEIRLTPSDAGKYEGAIKLSSGGQSASVLVSLDCFGNISGGISEVTKKLAEINPAKEVADDITSDIESAQNALTLGNYAQANEDVIRAQAKIETLEAGGVSKPMDLTWVIVVIVVIVVVLVFLWFFWFRKPKGEEEMEGEVEELQSFG